MSRLTLIALVGVAGAVGTLARWGLASWANRLAAGEGGVAGGGWPGTLAVNLLGCLAFGIIWGLSERHGVVSAGAVSAGVVSAQARVVMLVGFMGAFTTFSSLAFDTGELMRAGRLWAAMANLAANNVLGLGLFFAGAWVVGGFANEP